MAHCICFVQQGQIPDAAIVRLERGIEALVRRARIDDGASVTWIVVPPGDGWTAGALSTASVVSITAPDLPQARREAALHALCGLWMSETGCSQADILATIMPSELEVFDAAVPV